MSWDKWNAENRSAGRVLIDTGRKCLLCEKPVLVTTKYSKEQQKSKMHCSMFCAKRHRMINQFGSVTPLNQHAREMRNENVVESN